MHTSRTALYYDYPQKVIAIM